MVDRVGQQFGNYRLVRLLGKGGFAEVYLGEHIHLGTQAAIKVLTAELTSKEMEQFYKEARLIAHLEHDHIVPVLDFGIENTVPYLVMRYAPVGTLRDRHPKGTPVPLATVVAYVKQIAEALHYAHEKKVIHRDIKPQNILLSPKNEIWLSDFGIAVIAHNTASLDTQTYKGTLHYSAPEQIQDKPRQTSDQYALGVVVYEWLAGTLPFSGDIAYVIQQHLSTPPPPLREWIPSISPEVEQVVMRTLEKNPEKRFPSVRAFADALEACLPKPGMLPLTYHGHSDEIRSIVWSPDGKYIATASSSGNPVQFWEVTTGQQIFTQVSTKIHEEPGSSYTMAWSPVGQQIAIKKSGYSVDIYNILSEEKVSTCYDNGHSIGQVGGMTWSPDGQRIALEIEDGQRRQRMPGEPLWFDKNRVVVWEVATQQKIWTCQLLHEHHRAKAIVWSPDGKLIAIAADGPGRGSGGSGDLTAIICDAATGQKISGLVAPYRCFTDDSPNLQAIAWTPEGVFIASAGLVYEPKPIGSVVLWDAETGKQIFRYNKLAQGSALQARPRPYVRAVAWSPNGKLIAFGCIDNVVQVWDTTTWQIRRIYTDHTGAIVSLAWSPDGKCIASGSKDNTVQVWQAI